MFVHTLNSPYDGYDSPFLYGDANENQKGLYIQPRNSIAWTTRSMATM